MQYAKYKKTNVILVEDPANTSRYIVYTVTGTEEPSDDLPSYVSKTDRGITLINPNRMGPKELRAFCRLLMEEVVATVDFINAE